MRKLQDIVLYADPAYYPAFPSLVRQPNGELLLAFRRAPNRLAWGETQNLHVDPNSYLVTLRSPDGLTWEGEPDLLHAHAFGGSQDPCLLPLRDGTLLCASYGWSCLLLQNRRPAHLPRGHGAGHRRIAETIQRAPDVPDQSERC